MNVLMDPWLPCPPHFDMVWRTSEEGMAWIKKEKMVPDLISFACTLRGDDTSENFIMKLIEYDVEHDVIPPTFKWAVHENNPVCQQKIHSLLSTYLENKKRRMELHARVKMMEPEKK